MSHAIQDAPPAAAPTSAAPDPSTETGLGWALKEMHKAAARIRDLALHGGHPPTPILQAGVIAGSWTPRLPFSLLAACHVKAGDELIDELKEYGFIEPATNDLIDAILEVALQLDRAEPNKGWCYQDGSWHYSTPGGLRPISADALRQLLPDLEAEEDGDSAPRDSGDDS